MSEANLPFGEITVDNESVPLTRDNFSLYRHLGINAVYDHCYIKRPQGGAYIWAYHPAFEKYAELAQVHEAYMVLNKPEPSDSDREFFVEHITEDLEYADDFAKRWSEEQAEI